MSTSVPVSRKRCRSASRSPSPPAKKARKVCVFYSRSKVMADRLLSNFADTPFRLNDRWYPTAEHAYQSRKFLCSNKRELALQFSTESAHLVPQVGLDALSAKRTGSKKSMKAQKAVLDEAQWEEHKVEWTRCVLDAKFRQHTAARQHLLATRNEELQHFERRPDFWGCHTRKSDGQLVGKNMLGKLLEELRATLEKESIEQ